MNTDLKELADSLVRNVFVEETVVARILADVQSGQITESEAAQRLQQVKNSVSQGPYALSVQQASEEWSSLLAAMTAEGKTWQQIARRQFAQGFVLLPVVILVVLGVFVYLSTKMSADELATSAVPLLAVCLGTVAAHAFLVFRVHQQARVAAERLSEKRAAILFMRIAISRSDPAESARLLQAGTAMFLGHHAMPAVPLLPADKPSAPAIALQHDL